MEIGEPKKTHTNVPKPNDIPELEPEVLPEPVKIEPKPEKKEEEVPA